MTGNVKVGEPACAQVANFGIVNSGFDNTIYYTRAKGLSMEVKVRFAYPLLFQDILVRLH